MKTGYRLQVTGYGRSIKVRLKKGDTVIIRSGKYKGHSGQILAVQPRLGLVTVEGVNLATRHRKPTANNPRPTAEKLTRPIAISKVGLYDPGSKKASRVGYKLIKNRKVRYLKTSGKEIK